MTGSNFKTLNFKGRWIPRPSFGATNGTLPKPVDQIEPGITQVLTLGCRSVSGSRLHFGHNLELRHHFDNMSSPSLRYHSFFTRYFGYIRQHLPFETHSDYE